MDFLRELAPFLVGMIIPPVIMLVLRKHWSSLLKFSLVLVPALLIGLFTSAWAGELAQAFPDNLVSVLIDTSLVYLGSQVAYRFVWKPVLQARLERRAEVAAQKR